MTLFSCQKKKKKKKKEKSNTVGCLLLIKWIINTRIGILMDWHDHIYILYEKCSNYHDAHTQIGNITISKHFYNFWTV